MGQFVGTNKEEMIQSRQNLKYYLLEDLKRFNNNKPNLKDRILHNEVWYIYHYIRHLRYVEYYKNTKKEISKIHKLCIKVGNIMQMICVILFLYSIWCIGH